MSDIENPTPESSTPDGKACANGAGQRPRRSGFRRFLGFALVVGGLSAIPVAVAVAGPFGPGHGGGGCHGGGVESAEELRQHMDRGAGFMLGRLDATEDQEARIGAVLDRLAPELFALKAEHQSLREEAHSALTGETVDAAEIEGLRKEGLALADEASRLLVSGVVEIAQVLTPEQRAEAGEMAERFHGRK